MRIGGTKFSLNPVTCLRPPKPSLDVRQYLTPSDPTVQAGDEEGDRFERQSDPTPGAASGLPNDAAFIERLNNFGMQFNAADANTPGKPVDSLLGLLRKGPEEASKAPQTAHELARQMLDEAQVLRQYCVDRGPLPRDIDLPSLDRSVNRSLIAIRTFKEALVAGNAQSEIPAEFDAAAQHLRHVRVSLFHAWLRKREALHGGPGQLESLAQAAYWSYTDPQLFDDSQAQRIGRVTEEIQSLRGSLQPDEDLGPLKAWLGRMRDDLNANEAFAGLRRAVTQLRQHLSGVPGLHAPETGPIQRKVEEQLDLRVLPRPGADPMFMARNHGRYDACYAAALGKLGQVAGGPLQGRARNSAICELMQTLHRALPGNDARLLRFMRVASLFMDKSDRVSFLGVKGAMCQMVLGKATPLTPPGMAAVWGPEDVGWGADPRRLRMLLDELPRMLSALDTPEQVNALLDKLPDETDADGRNVKPSARSMADGLQAMSRKLDADGASWLDRSASRSNVMRFFAAAVSAAQAQPAAAQLGNVAGNLAALPPERVHKFVQMLQSACRWDEQRVGASPLLPTRERYQILKSLVLQLPNREIFGNRSTQNSVLRLVSRELEGRRLPPAYRAALLTHLVATMPALKPAKLLNHRNPQGVAAKVVVDGLSRLPADAAEPVLRFMVDELGRMSSRPSASSELPATRDEGLRFIGQQLGAAMATGGFSALGPLAQLFKGAGSPQKQLADAISGYLEGRIGRLERPPGPSQLEAILPVVRRIVTEPVAADPRLEQRLVVKALLAMCNGGLPLGVGEGRRTELLKLAFGEDIGVRVGVAALLADLCSKTHDNVKLEAHTRLGAARLLHSLLAANGGELQQSLRADELAGLHDAIGSAITTVAGRRGARRSAIALSLLRESETGHGWRDMPDALRRLLSTCALGGIAQMAPEQAAALMPMLIAGFDKLTGAQREDFLTALKGRVDAAGREQMPVLSVVSRGLGLYQGNRPQALAERVHDKGLWRGLSPEMRSAALAQLADDFGQATGSGQTAIIAFIDRLPVAEKGAAAVSLLKGVLGDEEVLGAIGPEGRARVEDCLQRCIDEVAATRAGAVDLAPLAQAMADHAASIPESAVARLIPHAGRIPAAALRPWMCAWLDGLAYKTPEEARAGFDRWAGQLQPRQRQGGPQAEQRAVLQTMLSLACKAAPQKLSGVVVPGGEHFDPAVLRDAVPALSPAHGALALDHAGELRAEDAPGLLDRLAEVKDEAARQTILRHCFEGAPSQTLETVGAGFGQVQMLDGGQFVRRGLEQVIPVRQEDGRWLDTSFEHLLRTQPPAIISPAVGKMAVLAGRGMLPTQDRQGRDFRHQFFGVLQAYIDREAAQLAHRDARQESGNRIRGVLDELLKPLLAEEVVSEHAEAIRDGVTGLEWPRRFTPPQSFNDFLAKFPAAGDWSTAGRSLSRLPVISEEWRVVA